MKKASNNIENIYDGRVYKRFFSNGGFLDRKNNISFMWYSDGISIFRSSHFSIWPMYLVVNELPYRERVKKKNIILAGLFFGNSKPNPNFFLHLFTHTFKNFLLMDICLIHTMETKFMERYYVGLVICKLKDYLCDLSFITDTTDAVAKLRVSDIAWENRLCKFILMTVCVFALKRKYKTMQKFLLN